MRTLDYILDPLIYHKALLTKFTLEPIECLNDHKMMPIGIYTPKVPLYSTVEWETQRTRPIGHDMGMEWRWR